MNFTRLCMNNIDDEAFFFLSSWEAVLPGSLHVGGGSSWRTGDTGSGCLNLPMGCCPIPLSKSSLRTANNRHRLMHFIGPIHYVLHLKWFNLSLTCLRSGVFGGMSPPLCLMNLSRSFLISSAWWNTFILKSNSNRTPVKKTWGEAEETRPCVQQTHPGLLTLVQVDLQVAFEAFLHADRQHWVVGTAVQHRFNLRDAAQRQRIQLCL